MAMLNNQMVQYVTTKVADQFHFASISMSQFQDVSRV